MHGQMKRREFIALLGGAAASTWPLAARAQQPVMPVIGFLVGVSHKEWARRIEAVRQGLRDLGFVDGRTVGFEDRFADGRLDRLPEFAADLVSRKVDAIYASTAVAIKSAMAATKTIPIVFTVGGDPVAAGYVVSFSRPGGNVTGVTAFSGPLGPKRLELFHELLPSARRIGLLINQNNPATSRMDADLMPAAARRLGLDMTIHRGGSERDIDAAFPAMIVQRVDALFVGNDAYFTTRRDQIAGLALRHRLPSSFNSRESVEAGGLMRYGGIDRETYRQAGIYLGRILKGEKPSDLPVIQPTKFSLMINLKTAKALGLNIPESFLLRADEVIE
jgi:putative ABC transport system substrate-binding protein